jgi:hypothetical protein
MDPDPTPVFSSLKDAKKKLFLFQSAQHLTKARIRIRIREAQKHPRPDPDPQHWFHLSKAWLTAKKRRSAAG